MTDAPACPVHGPMKIAEVSVGDKFVGVLWFCVDEDCQECEEYDEGVYGEYEPRYSQRPGEKQMGLWEVKLDGGDDE